MTGPGAGCDNCGIVLTRRKIVPVALDSRRRQRYRDYASWPDDERWELIDGVAYAMTPAPTLRHQTISLRLAAVLLDLLKAGPSRVFTAPVDVLLPEGDEADEAVETVVQPDIIVVCNPERLGDKYVRGAPDWIVEILSPATAKKDESLKRDRYQRAGVKDYWLVHPTDRTVTCYRLDGGSYGRPEVYGEDDRPPVPMAPAAAIDLAAILAD
jgi:Uma2 family endonuclease